MRDRNTREGQSRLTQGRRRLHCSRLNSLCGRLFGRCCAFGRALHLLILCEVLLLGRLCGAQRSVRRAIMQPWRRWRPGDNGLILIILVHPLVVDLLPQNVSRWRGRRPRGARCCGLAHWRHERCPDGYLTGGLRPHRCGRCRRNGCRGGRMRRLIQLVEPDHLAWPSVLAVGLAFRKAKRRLAL